MGRGRSDGQAPGCGQSTGCAPTAGQGPRSPLGTGHVASGEDGEQNSELGCLAEGTGSWLCCCWTQSIGAFSPAERTLILDGIHDALRFQFVRINLESWNLALLHLMVCYCPLQRPALGTVPSPPALPSHRSRVSHPPVHTPFPSPAQGPRVGPRAHPHGESRATCWLP